MNNGSLLMIVLLVACVVIFFFLRKRFKFVKVGSLAMVTGGVKCGKSTFSVALAFKELKRRQRSWRFRAFFQKLFRVPVSEKPLLYSNIPLAVPYVPLTKDLLLRKQRFAYNSVVYFCEASLVADSQCIRDKQLNDRLLLLNKLCGHELHGGCFIYDTQCISDVHYSIKRCLSEYFYIHHLVKWIPFFLLAYVKEERYSEDGSIINVNDNDAEDNLRKVIIPKSVWKKFDCYTYSAITDNLPVADNVVTHTQSLKTTNIVTFKDFESLL